MEDKKQGRTGLNNTEECEFCSWKGATVPVRTQGEVFNLCLDCFEYQEQVFDAEIVGEKGEIS